MANPEHLAILKQGVEKWNQWRRQYPENWPDLSNVPDLGHAVFGEYEVSLEVESLFKSARWRGFAGANFVAANLQDCGLKMMNLAGADLTDANLDS
ncbi:MAG: pentapeptide repeat-containing protein, partial [Candidatus Korobacteraceae bacterium]